MSRLTKIQWQELRSTFLRSEGTSTTTCDVCHKQIPSFKQWFERASYYENEWNCYCARCALRQIHLYDDFDFDLFETICSMNECSKVSP